MPIYHSRALAGSNEPRPGAKRFKDPIQYDCPTCSATYSLSPASRLYEAGTFVTGQGHLLVTCPRGHRETIQTTMQHIV
jgi:hypothetical protein